MSTTRLALYNLPTNVKEAELSKLFAEAGSKDGKHSTTTHEHFALFCGE